MPDKIFCDLQKIIINRFKQNREKSLKQVYDLDPEFLQYDPVGTQFVFENRRSLHNLLQSSVMKKQLLDLFMNYSLEFTFRNNQFLNITTPHRNSMKETYRRYLMDFKSILSTTNQSASMETKMRKLIRNHFIDLKMLLSQFMDSELANSQNSTLVFQKKVCAEYSPQLQLHLLHLNPFQLKAPILDLGCGNDAHLVKYLNQLGQNAVGLDRIPPSLPNCFQADWQDIRFPRATWGTIISHMAFSNHFLFHHLAPDGRPERFAQQFMMLLQSLKPGGSFFYSPGLPFIEHLLPVDQYKIRKFQIPLDSAKIFDRESAGFRNMLYSVQIIKKFE